MAIIVLPEEKRDTINVEVAVHRLDFGGCIISNNYIYIRDTGDTRHNAISAINILTNKISFVDRKDLNEFLREDISKELMVFGTGMKEALKEYFLRKEE